MKIHRLEDGQLYIVADKLRPSVRNAMAGPFKHRFAAYYWIIEHVEASLTPEKMALWTECLALAGGAKANPEHLLGIIAIVRRNRPRDFALKCSRPILHDDPTTTPRSWLPYGD